MKNIGIGRLSSNNHFMKKKCIVVGSGNCGKSSLLSGLQTGVFPEDDFLKIDPFSLTEKDITIEFNDTERFQNLYYKNFDIVLICFEVTSSYSYLKILDYFSEAKEQLPLGHFIFLGLKTDLRETTELEEELKKENLEKKFKDYGYPYVECSAKKNEGIQDLVLTLRETLQKLPGPIFTKEMVSEEFFHTNFTFSVNVKDDLKTIEFLCNKMKSLNVFQYFKPDSSLLKSCSKEMFMLLLSQGIIQDFNLCLYYLIDNFKLHNSQVEIAQTLFELGADPTSKVVVKKDSKDVTIDLMKCRKSQDLEKVFKDEVKIRNKIKDQLEKEEMKQKLKALEEKMDLIISLLKK